MKNKSKFIFFIIFGCLLLIFIPILARFLREIFEIYKLNFDKIPKNYLKYIAFDKKTYLQFLNLNNPFNALGLAVLAWYVISYFLNSLTGVKSKNKYEQIDKYGSDGTARWQTNKEIVNNYYKSKKGWYLGSLNKNDYNLKMDGAYIPVDGELNMQVTVIGPPGSTKTTGLVLPNIFNICDAYSGDEERPDILITDPKSELFSLSSSYLKDNGYDIKVLDFINLLYGDSLNCFDYISDDKTLLQISKNYVDSVEKVDGDQEFWNEQEAQLLAALMGFVKQKFPPEERTFKSVSKLLTSDTLRDAELDFFDRNNVTGAAKQMWKNFFMIADASNTKADIMGGLATKLSLFAISDVNKITNSTTFDISELGMKKKKPIALYIFISPNDRTFAPLISVILSTIFKQLYKNAFNNGSHLEVPVYFILEEMANIGKINDIAEMLGTMRGVRIYPMMIWQSLAQMKQRYKDNWEDMLSMCDTKVYLGISDPFTAKYCSDTLGNTTIRIQGISNRNDSGFIPVNHDGENYNYKGRKLLFPDECMAFDRDKMIVWQISRHSFILYKTQYKYWIKDNVLCKFTNVNDLNVLCDLNNDDYNIDNGVNNITHSEEIVKGIETDTSNLNSSHISLKDANIDTKAIDSISRGNNDDGIEI